MPAACLPCWHEGSQEQHRLLLLGLHSPGKAGMPDRQSI